MIVCAEESKIYYTVDEFNLISVPSQNMKMNKVKSSCVYKELCLSIPVTCLPPSGQFKFCSGDFPFTLNQKSFLIGHWLHCWATTQNHLHRLLPLEDYLQTALKGLMESFSHSLEDKDTGDKQCEFCL